MKIGIITFHWSTNYGAILQCYALQTYLLSQGHDVCVINYKPKKYDYSLLNFIRYKDIKKNLFRPWIFYNYLKDARKDSQLDVFRVQYLNQTKRYTSIDELRSDPPLCDVYITGSDQVLNPSILLNGERKNYITKTYYLDFGLKSTRRIGYAVSFGCDIFPTKGIEVAEPLLKNFDAISVRENTGLSILESMNYVGGVIAPDPTLLLSTNDYIGKLGLVGKQHDTYFAYVLRDDIKQKLATLPLLIKLADTSGLLSIENWLNEIRNSKGVITNSYHGTIFSIIFRTPFVVISKRNCPMIDRIKTLLGRLELEDRHIYYDEIDKLPTLIIQDIDWEKTSVILDRMQKDGQEIISL